MNHKRYVALYLCYILITLSPHLVMADFVIKPAIGYGSLDLNALALGPFYGGQTGFSADIGLGQQGLISLFGSIDATWWQEPNVWRASGQGGVEVSSLQDIWTFRSSLFGTCTDDPVTSTNLNGDVQLHVTAIRNGPAVSLRADGSVQWVFGQSYDTKYTGSFSAALLWGEMVVKPAFTLSGALTQNLIDSWEMGPTLGLSWYPSFPVSLDLSVLYHLDMTNEAHGLQVLTDLAVQPLPLFGFSLSHEANWTQSDYTGAAGVELRINLGASHSYNSWYFVSGSLGYGFTTYFLSDWNIKTGIGLRL